MKFHWDIARDHAVFHIQQQQSSVATSRDSNMLKNDYIPQEEMYKLYLYINQIQI